MLGVQVLRQQEDEHHQEEDAAPEGTDGQLRQTRRVDDEDEARSRRHDLVQFNRILFREEADNSEDGEAEVEGSGAVDDGHSDGVAADVVPEVVERRHRQEGALTNAQAEEYLGGSVRPH